MIKYKLIIISFFILLFSSSSFSIVTKIARTNKILAFAPDKIVTFYDVKIDLLLTRIYESRKKIGFKDFKNNISDKQVLEASNDYIDRVLILIEIEKLKIEDLIKIREINKEFEKFKSKFKSDYDFRRFLIYYDLSETSIKEFLANGMKIKKYLKRRLSLGLAVKDDEVERYFKENKKKFRGQELAEVKDKIKKNLWAKKRKQKEKTFFSDLRSKYKVRYPLDEKQIR